MYVSTSHQAAVLALLFFEIPSQERREDIYVSPQSGASEPQTLF